MVVGCSLKRAENTKRSTVFSKVFVIASVYSSAVNTTGRLTSFSTACSKFGAWVPIAPERIRNASGVINVGFVVVE